MEIYKSWQLLLLLKARWKARNLCTFEFWFERIVEMIKKYWKDRPSSVYMTYYSMKHKFIGN